MFFMSYTYNLSVLKKSGRGGKATNLWSSSEKVALTLKSGRSSVLSGRAMDNPELLAMHEHHA